MLNTFTLNLKQTVANLLAFLKKPTDSPETNTPTKGKLRELLNLLLLKALVALVFTTLIWAVSKAGWYKTDNHAVDAMLRSIPIWAALLSGILLIPMLEELMFRFGLRFRRGYFTFLSWILLLVGGIYAFKMLPLPWALGTAGILVALMVIYQLKANAIGGYLERIWPRVYGILFYSVAIVFGLIHLINFTDFNYASLAVLLIPVLVGSQIWGGLLMGYMRVKYGFFWGFFLHAAHNAVFMGLGLLTISQLEEKLNIRNENYSLKVEEHWRYDKTAGSNSIVSCDTSAFVNTELNEVITQLLQAEDISIQNNPEIKFTRAVNLYYKGETSDLNQTKAAILTELQKLYKFDITKADVEKEMWDVEVENSTALAANISDRDDKASEITVDKSGIKMHNVTIDQLLAALQKEYNVALADKTTDAGRYNFTFSKKGFAELKDELKEKYGLALQSKMIMTQQALVEFRK